MKGKRKRVWKSVALCEGQGKGGKGRRRQQVVEKVAKGESSKRSAVGAAYKGEGRR